MLEIDQLIVLIDSWRHELLSEPGGMNSIWFSRLNDLDERLTQIALKF